MNYQQFLEQEIKTLTADDMPTEDLSFIAAQCGVDVAISLILNCTGATFNVPLSSLDFIKKKYIVQNYDPARPRASVLFLAKQCQCSDRLIPKVLTEAGIKDPEIAQIEKEREQKEREIQSRENYKSLPIIAAIKERGGHV